MSDAEGYPATIGGQLILRTGDRIELTARLLDEIDDRGCRIYELAPTDGGDRLPVTQADYLAGGITIAIDMVPGRSGMRFGFLQEV